MLNPNEGVYLQALSETRNNGSRRKTRNGVTTATLAHQMRFDLQCGFPATTTKYLAFNVVVAENLWLIDGGKETGGRLSIKKLNQLLGKPDDAKNIWTHDQSRFASQGKAKFDGDCGRIYGAQWRDWRTSDGRSIDQLGNVIKQLKDDPFSRYHIVNAWNPGEIHDMCLPPCHMKMQFFVRPSNRRDKKMHLDLSMDQRSCDMFLGVPFNIASYALLIHMVAQCVDMVPGELVITLEDCHIYLAGLNENGNPTPSKGHLKQVNKQLERKPFRAPELWLNPLVKNIDDFTMNDIKLINYRSHEKILADLL
ncbi:MAG: thymidylate synthase [Candidatus Paceibacterota bacterium]|jgi:thymidylate synthase